MMKRNILAVVIPALLAAGAANAAEVYNKDGNKLDLNGRVHAGYTFNSSFEDDTNSDNTYARLGFKGETQISNELTGYGRFEYQFDGSVPESETDGSDSKTRYAFAGLKFGDFGSFDYGRNLGIAYDGLAYTDVLPENGGESSITDTLTGRTGNAATYRNNNFFGLVDGLNFGLQYVAKDQDNGTTRIDRQHGDAWGTSLSYDTDIGLSFVGSYASYKRTLNQQNDGKGRRAEIWTTGVKYDANNVYLAATYGEGRNFFRTGYSDADTKTIADKSQIFEAVAQYTFDFGLTPQLAYVSRKDKVESGINSTRANDYSVQYVSVGGTYAFNKNFSAYAEYDIDLLDDDSDYRSRTSNYGDRVDVGIIYQF
ncbi:porin [Samsonia erythrinae]|uniref:Outer membrane pore protein F n=1 Tax=Samsonia erythrinae TaxID=160434 RepID=A0A4R3VQ62_9GAMM|nr:porin [Samsonia erythrinae]TCV09235.1 outer membrane pore protein F [Samsonia erythrinae]